MMRADRSHSVDRIVSHNGEGLRRLAVVLKGVDGHRFTLRLRHDFVFVTFL